MVQYRNGSNETVQLRKNDAVGILDLKSIGYFKVGYQKMVNMAESSKVFKIFNYQQIKCESKTEVDQYLKITGRYSGEKGKGFQNNVKQIAPQQKSDSYP